MESNREFQVEFSLHSARRKGRASEMDPRRLPRVTQVLALAISFQEMISVSDARNYEDLASRTGVTAERLSQVMKLTWLAPSIQQEILYLAPCGGRHPLTEGAVRPIAAVSSWPEQLKLWTILKRELRLETRVEGVLQPTELREKISKEAGI